MIGKLRQRLRQFCGNQCSCDVCVLNNDARAKEISNRWEGCYPDIDDVDVLRELCEIVGIDPDAPDNENAVSDNVNSPSHYNQGSIECIDAIRESMSADEYKGFLKGQVIKYIWRYRHKGKPVEDLEKAKYYLNELIIEVEK